MKTLAIHKSLLFLFLIVFMSFACGGTAPTADPNASPESDAATQSAGADAIQPPPVDLPTERENMIGDYDSSLHGKTAPGGDRFSRGEYERPFNAYTMDVYFPYLDMLSALVYQDDAWIFGVFLFKSADENGAFPGNYALQLDTNVDGKSDWLIMAVNVTSTEWTTSGVEIWQDANADVGGMQPVRADENKVTSDGFEQKVFESGQGNGNDLAWARIDPHDPAVLHIAVKRSLINDDEYLANMWAGTSVMADPSKFDFNDNMTHEQAGAADPGLEIYYPIKGLAELDNTCRMAIGFHPSGNEPGLCREFVAQDPGDPAPPAATPRNCFAVAACP